jgi:hypothetical protein
MTCPQRFEKARRVLQILQQRTRKLSNILGSALERLDFWSLRDPNERLFVSGRKRPGLTRRQLCEETAQVVPAYALVRDFINSLFRFRIDSRANFSVEGGSKEVRQLAACVFLNRPYNSPPIGIFEIRSLEEVLRGVAWQLMVYGRTSLLAFWNEPKGWKHAKGLPQFRIVPPSAIRRVPPQQGLDGYQVFISRYLPPQDPEEIRVDAGDVLFFEWPLPPKRNKGISPVDRVVDAYSAMGKTEEAVLAIMRAHAYREDISFRAERARWKNLGKVNDELRNLRIDITAELYGFVSNQPMTKYFDAYQVLKYRERLATVREYLTNQFNIFVNRFSELAGYERSCRLNLIDYPTPEKIRETMEKLTAKQISVEQAISLTTDSTT